MYKTVVLFSYLNTSYVFREILLRQYRNSKLLSELQLELLGCTTYVHIQPNFRSKLDPRAIKCIFVGYSNSQKRYKCYCASNRRICVTLDVTFNKKHAFYRSVGETERLRSGKYELSFQVPNLPSSTTQSSCTPQLGYWAPQVGTTDSSSSITPLIIPIDQEDLGCSSQSPQLNNYL